MPAILHAQKACMEHKEVVSTARSITRVRISSSASVTLRRVRGPAALTGLHPFEWDKSSQIPLGSNLGQC